MCTTRECQSKREEIFIIFEKENIKRRLCSSLEKLAENTTSRQRIVIHLSFDGTKVSTALSMSTAHKAILGAAAPNHIIPIADKTEEEVKDMLDPKSTIERADEIKAAVVSIQTPAKRNTPFFCLVGQPQGINKPSTFNDHVAQSIKELCKEECMIDLASVAADGVGCDNKVTALLFDGSSTLFGTH